MTPANETELRQILASVAAPEIVSQLVIDRVPHVFADDWAAFRHWKTTLSGLLAVDQSDIAIIGSAAVGFSLNPHKALAAFSTTSDIDVAVISPFHFDEAWKALRAVRRGDAKSNREWEAVLEHKTRLIYYGAIATDKVLRFMPFSARWAKAALDIGAVDPTAGRDVKFRLYRDFESLRSYHITGVKSLKSEVSIQP